MTVTYSRLGNNGRFGNQLFQIASTIGIAKSNGHGYSFPRWEYQQYFKNKLPNLDYIKVSETLEEATTYYHEIKLDKNKDYDLSGYFQSYKYFDKYKETIHNYFTLNSDINITINYVAIHVRRGDYLHLDNHPVLPMEYYQSAISLFPPHTTFLVFSDDIAWCKENFNFNRNIMFSDSVDEISDFSSMKHCYHNIISNSSFSWWAAYLNCNPTKKVIAPSIYVANEDRTDDRYPKNWIVI